MRRGHRGVRIFSLWPKRRTAVNARCSGHNLSLPFKALYNNTLTYDYSLRSQRGTVTNAREWGKLGGKLRMLKERRSYKVQARMHDNYRGKLFSKMIVLKRSPSLSSEILFSRSSPFITIKYSMSNRI